MLSGPFRCEPVELTGWLVFRALNNPDKKDGESKGCIYPPLGFVGQARQRDRITGRKMSKSTLERKGSESRKGQGKGMGSMR